MWDLDYKESWALKTCCFWTVVLEKTLESLLDCKDIQPIHLTEISPEYSLEGLMLKLKLQYFGHLKQRTDSLEKTLMLGKIRGGRRRGRLWMRWLDDITDSMDMSLRELRGSVLKKVAWCTAVHGVAKNGTWLNNLTELTWGDGCLHSSSKRANVSFLYIFVLFKPSADWIMPTYNEVGHSLSSSTQI